MTSQEGNMLTMRIIKLLGIAGVAVLAAAWMAARVQRREQEERTRLNEQIEKRTLGERRRRKPLGSRDAKRGHRALKRHVQRGGSAQAGPPF